MPKAERRIPSIHPGETLHQDFLLPLGLTRRRLAMDLLVPATRINGIVRGKRAITADTALRLSRYFGTTAQFWMNLQGSYDLDVSRVMHVARRSRNGFVPHGGA